MKKLLMVLVALMILSSDVFADGRTVYGTAGVSNGSVDASVIPAQGAGVSIRVLSVVCAVEVAAVGSGGEIALENGANGTRIFQADADAVAVYSFNLAPNGYILSANTALNVTVDGAATTQATGSCTASGEAI